MDPSQLTIECAPFDRLKVAICAACGAGDDWTSPQFEYLQSYLQRGGARAKTMVIEKPYVDRHYLEEYGAYYFSALRNGGPTTTRIHFFATEFQKQLVALGLDDPKRIERFVSEIALPRYVGIVRFQLDDAALVDIVCDTTDIHREYPRRAPVLAVFPFSGKHVAPFQTALKPMSPWAIVL